MGALLQRYPRSIAAGILLAALTLAPAASAAPVPRFDISHFDVQGNTLLSTAELGSLLSPYEGKDRDFADVQHALEALQRAYAKHGFTLVRVTLPEQELDHGVVRLRVVEGRIRRVSVEGNRFFDAANIRRSVPGLREGETPDMARLSASLGQANENPAKKTTLELQGGEREGDVDARLRVVDEKPWTVALNVDNTGLPQTGRTLVGVVYQNANIAGLDQVLSLQYTTTAEKPNEVKVYGMGYHIPIYALGDSLDVYANYSDVNAGSVLAGIFALQVSGKGTVVGTRYTHKFARLGIFESALGAGFDHKAYRSGEEFEGVELGNDVTVHPLSLSYGGAWKATTATTAFNLTAVRNVPGGEHGTQGDFDRARAGSTAGYTLARMVLEHDRTLPVDWQIRLVATGQYTRDALIPGEQFGAGGVGSVRGFLTREIAGDAGVSGNAELYTPNLCGRYPGANAFCRALVFYDAARVSRNEVLPGEFEHATIASIGAGLRAALGRYAALQLDFAHVVDGGFVEANGHNQLNFRLSLSY